ncbi:MAG: response regulator transcription factor [Planctomycetes bacterium]|nr:response regulator transcription factor [Planctomycetota bacterium]
MSPTVFLIDDDQAVLKSLSVLLNSAGLATKSFLSAEDFLEDLSDGARGCVVTDLKLTGMSGLHLQEQLIRMRSPLPVIVVTGRADVGLAVKVMEYGAVTLIQKPYDHQELIDAVRKALEQNAHRHTQAEFISDVRNRLNSLTDDEQQVLQMVIDGKPNKAIATTLSISMRTVDRRRSSVFEKMDVQTAPELARLLTLIEQAPEQVDVRND